MASLVLGAAGAFVGSFFGPIGTSIGWSLGAAAGNALFPGKGQNGPRLTDLKLQGSSYGQMIPIEYGTVRIAGNVIWQTDLEEHAQKSGGKGGPEVTTYTYSASFAVYLCEGPIGGVLRIWADSRLVYDSSASDPTAFPFTLYLGTATQLVDPTMEAVEGVGNVPAHRNIAYVVFTDMFLTDYGNRIPSLTFEVFSLGEPIPWRYSLFPSTRPTGAPAGSTPWTWNNQARAGASGSGPQSGAIEDGVLVMSRIDDLYNQNAAVSMPVGFEIQSFDLDGNFIASLVTASMVQPPDAISTCLVANCINNPHITWALGGSLAGGTKVNAFYYDGAMTATPVFDPIGVSWFGIMALPSYLDNSLYGTGGNAGAFISRWAAPGGVVTNGNPNAHYYLPGIAGGSSWTTQVDNVLQRIWCVSVHDPSATWDEMFLFDAELNLIRSWPNSDFPPEFAGVTASGSYSVWNGIFYFQGVGSATAYAYSVDETTGIFTLESAGGGGSLVTFGGATLGPTFYNSISLGNGLLLVGNGLVSLQPRSGAVTLGDIVADLSVRAGLTTAQIDVSQLTDLVDGYVIAGQTDARSCIEPLQVAWPFDAVEHDVVVRFPRRGVDGLAAIIDDIDLGAFVPPGDPPAMLTTIRAQETDLPRIVDATFLNKDTDYQNGEARAQRLITTSELTTSLQLPIVMDSAKGLNIAETTLYQAWIERERFSLSLSRKWILLEPAAFIHAFGRSMRIVRKVEQADGIIKIDAVAASLAIYLHSAPSVEGVGMPGGGGTPPTSPPVIQDTDALLLDLPLIHDTDNAFGWYAAFAGHTQPAWPGATLFKSIDGGATFSSEIVDTISDTFGNCSSILGDFGGGNIFDESNALTVVLSAGSGTLSSTTRLAVLNGANLCAVGTVGTTGIRQIELLQFRDATLIAPLTYLLTGFLRGRRGTEWMIQNHVAAEKFVLLPTSTNVVGLSGEIYLPRIYRAVTSGRTLATAGDINFTNFAMANLPYAPTCLGGGRFPNDDLFLQWRRRTRIGGTWHDFVDVPLSESTEQYTVSIYADGSYATVVRTIITTTPSTIYSVAAQTADFGSPLGPIYWGVQQQGQFNLGTQARAVT